MSIKRVAFIGAVLAAMACAALWLTRPRVEVEILHSFAGRSDGRRPLGLMRATSGALYGLVEGPVVWGAWFTLKSNAAPTVLVHIEDGPASIVVEGVDGCLYGYGCVRGEVVLLQVDPSDEVRQVHSFGTWGELRWPLGLVRARDGHLYGMTRDPGPAFGTVFRITTNKAVRIVYRFDGKSGRVRRTGSLLAHSSGSLYGVTDQGGTWDGGTFFELTTDGQHRVLHSFPQRGPTRSFDYSLVEGGNGGIYGATLDEVFRVHFDGLGPSFRYYPLGGSVHGMDQGADGLIYVTTTDWKSYKGKLWQIQEDGRPTLLHTFRASDLGDLDLGPISLVSGGQDVFYGTSLKGGDRGWGTIFRLTVRR